MKKLSDLLARLETPREALAFLKTRAPHPEEAYQIPHLTTRTFKLAGKSHTQETLELHRHLQPGADKNETQYAFEAYWVGPSKKEFLGPICTNDFQNKNPVANHDTPSL